MDPIFTQYEAILDSAPGSDVEVVSQHLSTQLPGFWCAEYEVMTFTESYPYSPDELEIVSIPLGSLVYLYDMGDAYDEGSPDDPRVESRVVAVYGRSQVPKTKRDTSRMRGWLGPTDQYPGHAHKAIAYDKGHFIAHLSGGGLDINLFFQRRDINRGWSRRGKTYREMERYCAANIGTFCFSRPFYEDRSWHPCAIEYGLVLQEGALWVERFDN